MVRGGKDLPVAGVLCAGSGVELVGEWSKEVVASSTGAGKALGLDRVPLLREWIAVEVDASADSATRLVGVAGSASDPASGSAFVTLSSSFAFFRDGAVVLAEATGILAAKAACFAVDLLASFGL